MGGYTLLALSVQVMSFIRSRAVSGTLLIIAVAVTTLTIESAV